MTYNISTIHTLWRRDMLRFFKERSRWIGVVIHPLLVWLVVGFGIHESFSMQHTNYVAYFYPGIMVMSLLFTTMYATMSIIEDRSSGFLQAILVGPGSRSAMILGKMIGVTSLGILQILIFLLISPIAGYAYFSINWLGILLFSFLSLMGLTAINFAIAWKLNSTQGYHAIMNVILIPLWMLSGAIFPSGPAWIKPIMIINPLSYVVSGFRQSLAGHSVLDPHPLLSLGVLSGLLLVGFWVARKSCSFK